MKEEKKIAQEMKINEMNFRRFDKQFQQYCWFISQIKRGKTAVILSPNFVVRKAAHEQGVLIEEISLMNFWFTGPEMIPRNYKLLGIKIK